MSTTDAARRTHTTARTKRSRPRARSIGAVALGLLLLVAGATGAVEPVSAAGNTPAFTVDLRADGSATVAVTLTFDLSGDAEREAFRSLETDQEARQGATDRFLARMRAVANATEAATGREMTVTDPSIDVRTTEDAATGVVTLSVDWASLAAERDDRLVLTEPFASEFTPDRRFVVTAPDGYEIVSASLEPAESSASSVAWAAGSALDGFEVVAAPTDGEDGHEHTEGEGEHETGSPGQPGLGFGAAVLAVLVAIGIRTRRG